MYEPRTYRNEMNSDRFRFFSVVHRESDLMVGVSHQSYHPSLEQLCQRVQSELYLQLSEHIEDYPSFATSLVPLPVPKEKQPLYPGLDSMYRCAWASETGPMSSVAGLFAEVVGRSMLSEVSPAAGELVVENGGDIYLNNYSEMVVLVHAGSVALSGRLGLVLPPGEWGVCTSSGKVGHSFSKGQADAVTVVSHSTPLADAWATSLANRIKGREDIRPMLALVEEIPDIKACVVIAGGELGIRSEFETKLLPWGE